MRPGKPPHVPSVLWLVGDAFAPPRMRAFLNRKSPTLREANGWSVMHLLSGVGTRAAGLAAQKASLVHASWELYQVAIGMSRLSQAGKARDILQDTIFFELGSRVVAPLALSASSTGRRRRPLFLLVVASLASVVAAFLFPRGQRRT